MRNQTNLSYFVFDNRIENPEGRQVMRATFEMWQKVWSETLRELDGLERVFSDDFTRPTLVGALFSDTIPIGSISLSRVDLREPMYRADSSLKAWPADVLHRVSERYRDEPLWVCTYLTVASAHRGRAGTLSLKELLVALVVEHLRASDCGATLATVRVDRGMDRTCFDLGAKLVEAGRMLHGVEVSLIEFDKGNLQIQQGHPCVLPAARLFRDRIDFPKLERLAAQRRGSSRIA